jgi:hypothetical protein
VHLNTCKCCSLSVERCKHIITCLVCDAKDLKACRKRYRAAFHGQPVCFASSPLCKMRLPNVVEEVPTVEACMSIFLRHFIGQAVFVQLVHLHLLSSCELSVVYHPVSNAKRTNVATVPGYIPTQYSTQLDLLGNATFTQAIPNAHEFPHNVYTLSST